MAAAVAGLLGGGFIRALLLMIGGTFVLSAASNFIGSLTGQNPMAQTAATMLQTVVPLMVTMMPMIMVMNMMVTMTNMMMAPFVRLAAPAPPAFTYFA